MLLVPVVMVALGLLLAPVLHTKLLLVPAVLVELVAPLALVLLADALVAHSCS